MNIKVTCPGCNEQNDFFRLNCTNCGYLLRDKVPNIDLWGSFWNLFLSPSETLKKIIWAKHKNFMSFLLILISVTVFFNLKILLALFKPALNVNNLPLFLFTFFSTIILFASFSFVFMLITKKLEIKTRWKDNLALLTYAQIPMIISLLVLLPSAYAIFGKYLFSFKAMLHDINESAAYFIYFLEVICLLWSVSLTFIGLKLQTGKILLPLLSSIVLFIAYNFIVLFVYL